MALIKPVATGFGVAARYWNILSLELNRAQNAAQVTMAGYVDEDARRGGHQPLAVVPLAFAGADLPGAGDGIAYRDLYDRIKAAAAAAAPGTPLAVFAAAVDG